MAEFFKLLAAATLVLLLNSSFALKVDNYKKCPKGKIVNNTVQSAAPARSALECFQRCSQRQRCSLTQRCSQKQRCSGVNVCTHGSLSTVSCELLHNVPSTDCEDLTSETFQACYYAQKVRQAQEVTTGVQETTQTSTEMTTTEIVCQNGGTPNGEGCDCTEQYGGRTCHRFIRDCTEAFENGYQSTTYNGHFQIQPTSSTQPFSVLCFFASGGMTLPLRRRDTSEFNKDWNTCKVGFGDDLFSNPTSYNFFIGLEKLHQLTRQASYRFEQYIEYYNYGKRNGSAFYHNVTIGPESESYALTYDQFDTAASTIDNGFSTSPPLKFEADGKYSCNKYGGVAGWFGSDCEGYTVFTDGEFIWNLNVPNSDWYVVNMLEFRLVRSSSFYEG